MNALRAIWKALGKVFDFLFFPVLYFNIFGAIANFWVGDIYYAISHVIVAIFMISVALVKE